MRQASNATTTTTTVSALTHTDVTIVATLSAFGTLMLLGVALRLYSRIKILKSIGVDDVCISLSAALATVTNLLYISANSFTTNPPTVENVHDYRLFSSFGYAVNIFPILTVGLTRCAILLFYMRFYDTRLFRYGVWITLVLASLWTIGFTIPLVMQCKPMEGFVIYEPWFSQHKQEVNPHCNETALEYFMASNVSHVILDVVVYALPIPTIVKMKLPKKQRVILGILMTLGASCCAIALVRMLICFTAPIGWIRTHHIGDFLWVMISTEYNLAIFCASIPVAKPLLLQMFNTTATHITRTTSRLSGGAEQISQKRSSDNIHKRGYIAHELEVIPSTDDLHGLDGFHFDLEKMPSPVKSAFGRSSSVSLVLEEEEEVTRREGGHI